MNRPLIELRAVVKKFPADGGAQVSAVDRVSLSIQPGESLGLVGESGSGKSTLGLLMTRLTPVSSGQIIFDGQDITHLSDDAMRQLRSQIQMVFQDPWGALNPRMTVGRSMAEPLKLHTRLTEVQRQQAVSDLADRVHLPKASLQRFPHELSGGQLQRVCIARAIASKPRLLVLDEPTSSLDLSVRAGILELLDTIRKETGVALLLISHDLETVELMTQRLLVLYLGRVVEQGPTREIFNQPAHPYTQTLMSANLPADPTVVLSRLPNVGEIPSPLNLPAGCLFSSRCPLVRAQCQQAFPAFSILNGSVAHSNVHEVACNRVADASHWLTRTHQNS